MIFLAVKAYFITQSLKDILDLSLRQYFSESSVKEVLGNVDHSILGLYRIVVGKCRENAVRIDLLEQRERH